MPDDAAHLNKVHDAAESVLDADGKLKRNRLHAQTLHQIVDAIVEIGPDLVHFVGEDDPRNLILVGLTPDRLGLGLNALVSVQNRHSAVENAKRALHLDREVHMAWGIDDVQTLVLPEAGGGGRRDRDAPLLLLLHPVHCSRAIMDFTDLVINTGVEKDAFGGRGLAGVDMRHDSEISVVGELVSPRHGERPVLSVCPVRRITSGSARRPCWLQPCGACLHAS